MKKILSSVSILSPVPIPPPPTPPPGLSADVVASGLPVHPEERIRLFSASQWELFIQEWVDSLRDEYELVERCGGAGDMGRDVIATVKGGNGIWDNYQCKHYEDSLKPGDIWVELGKLAYYTKRGDFSYPRRYYFIAPRGAGTKLSNLLKKPQELRSELFQQWDKHCRERITKTMVVECDAAMKAHIENLDFSIFQAIDPALTACVQLSLAGPHLASGSQPAAPPPMTTRLTGQSPRRR